MRIEIRTHRIDVSEVARKSVERPVLLALGRLAPRVPHVRVWVSDATPEATNAGRPIPQRTARLRALMGLR